MTLHNDLIIDCGNEKIESTQLRETRGNKSSMVSLCKMKGDCNFYDQG